MSAPHTNVKKQAKRHAGPLVGLAVVVVFAGLLFLAWLFWVTDEDATPHEAAPEGAVTEPYSN